LATETDAQHWNNYVVKHKEQSPYHLFFWQQAVQQAYQHKNCYLIAEQQQELTHSKEQVSTVVGIFPIIIFNKPLGKSHFCSLPYCDVGHILADNEAIKTQLINKAKEIAQNHSASFIEIRGFSEANKAAENTLESEKVRMLLTLPESSELLFSSFKSKLRSQIRKAEKNGLTYKLESNNSLLDDFYRVFSHNMKALGSPVHAKSWFQALFNAYNNKMIISVVYHENIAIGAGIVLLSGNKASIPWASTIAEYNRLSPNMLLYWSFLKYVSDNNITEFDFGRSSYGEGTYKFKKQWGAEPVPLCWNIIPIQQTITTELASSKSSNLRAIVEKIWQKLPLSFTVFLGPKIRKYISL
jgi:FemAB-related protein (PEP-CTERM system-associated)